MTYMTEDQAVAEVNKWKVVFKDLKTALVTRQSMWKMYEEKNNDWAASVAEMGVTAASSVLTGSATFSAIQWIVDTLIDNVQGGLVDAPLEKGINCIAGAYVTQYDPVKGYEISADTRFATKVASGFVTILIAAAGGALTIATAGTTAAVTAIALIVRIGDQNEVEKRERWNKTVNSAIEKYDAIRREKIQQINKKHRTELERCIMSEAYQDLEDKGLVRSYEWKSGNMTNRARYPKHKLQQLLEYLKTVDRELGSKLWVIDVLEVARVFSEETKDLWHTIEVQQKLAQSFPKARVAMKFNDDRVREFMRRQVDSHVEIDKASTTKTDKALEAVREDALKEYGRVTEILKVEEDFEEVFLDEGSVVSNNPKSLKYLGGY